MAEFVYNPVQLVEPNQNILLQDSIPCGRGYVIHRNGSGILTLRGIVNNPCAKFTRYQVTFNGNIALPLGSTVGPIAVALSIGGEAIQASKAIATPTSTEAYFNVTSTAIIDVPVGCCYNLAIENISSPATVGGTAPEINVQNANLVISRVA